MPDRDETYVWRDDIDSLAFRPDSHAGWCVMHRRAFRTLLGFEPTPQDCLEYFDREQLAIRKAASKKTQRATIAPDQNFHLNSRDIRRS